MAQITGGLRFTIENHGIIKLEVGLHNYLFVGLAAGVQF
jgi:hypothetical protein